MGELPLLPQNNLYVQTIKICNFEDSIRFHINRFADRATSLRTEQFVLCYSKKAVINKEIQQELIAFQKGVIYFIGENFKVFPQQNFSPAKFFPDKYLSTQIFVSRRNFSPTSIFPHKYLFPGEMFPCKIYPGECHVREIYTLFL